MSKGEWLAYLIRRRVAGRAGVERDLRGRFAAENGRPLPDEADGLTAMLYHRMIAANRTKDVSLGPYVDKYAVRKHVVERVGSKVLVPLVWTGVNPLSIPWTSPLMPAVLKTNHMSQAVIVLNADADRRAVTRKALRWMGENYYWSGGEYQYRGIRPRLLLEEFLDDGTENGPRDYSFWCVHGDPLFVQVRDSTGDLREAYDLEWRPLDVLQPGPRRIAVERPAALLEMTQIARTLSAPFSFVRVDLYDVHGVVRFGELTFTPASGRLRLRTPAIDRFLGDVVTAGADALPGARERLAALAADLSAPSDPTVPTAAGPAGATGALPAGDSTAVVSAGEEPHGRAGDGR